jgi:hypothetical protein
MQAAQATQTAAAIPAPRRRLCGGISDTLIERDQDYWDAGGWDYDPSLEPQTPEDME